MVPFATYLDAGYQFALFFHIVAVVVALGPTFGYGVMFSVLPNHPRSAPALIEGMRRVDRYLVNPRDHAWHFGAMLLGREGHDFEEVKKHARAWLIKGFFGAFMLSILPPGFQAAVTADYGAILGNPAALGMALKLVTRLG